MDTRRFDSSRMPHKGVAQLAVHQIPNLTVTGSIPVSLASYNQSMTIHKYKGFRCSESEKEMFEAMDRMERSWDGMCNVILFTGFAGVMLLVVTILT